MAQVVDETSQPYRHSFVDEENDEDLPATFVGYVDSQHFVIVDGLAPLLDDDVNDNGAGPDTSLSSESEDDAASAPRWLQMPDYFATRVEIKFHWHTEMMDKKIIGMVVRNLPKCHVSERLPIDQEKRKEEMAGSVC